MPSSQSAGYFRRRGWKDLIFLCVVFLMWLEARHLINMREALKRITDHEKWERRPQLSLSENHISQNKPGATGLPPCFFIAPTSPPGQNIVSGSVGDCVLLVPDGKQWDTYEVNLQAGRFVPINTDIYVRDTVPLAFTRIYRPLDQWSKRMQIYLMDVYDPYLFGKRNPYSSSEWELPDEQVFHYKRISPGWSFASGLFEHSGTTPLFGGSRIAWNGFGWDVSLADGETYLSPEAGDATRASQGSLVGIFDRDGNEVHIAREENGDLTEIRSPSGYWIRIAYVENRISRVDNNSGDYVAYEYDSENRLERTKSSQGLSFEYLYDASNRIRHVASSKAGVILQVNYYSNGWVSDEILADGSAYHFDYVDTGGQFAEIDVAGPRSEVTRVRLHGDGYSVEKSP